MPKPDAWDQLLRKQIKLEHGRGWSVSPQSGKAKLTRRYPDGTRSSVTLAIPWAASSGSAINTSVARLRQLMEERGLGLQETHALTGLAEANAGEADGLNWRRVADQFLESRADRRAATLGGLRFRVSNVLATLSKKPRPRDGRSLMRAYAAQHFAKCPPGGKGRKAHLGDVAGLLEFAVTRCGAEACWKPLEGEELRELIGAAERASGEELTRPIKPEQLAALLDALRDEGKAELQLAVGLVGLFGLRPAELAVLRVDEEGRLRVGAQVKRNRWSMSRPKSERLIGRDQKTGWGVTYTARVRVTVTAGRLTPLVREGSGAGHGIDVDLGQAHESALKEAETDAMKRALMTFGNPFGLALYDKRQREVSSAAGQGDGPQRPGGQRSSLSRPEAGSSSAAAASPAQGRTQATAPTPPPSAPADLGQVPLDTKTIQHLHSTLRALPRPLLESLTRAFRKRFQVPEEAATIADRINQKCHHDWIETFLVQHQASSD